MSGYQDRILPTRVSNVDDELDRYLLDFRNAIEQKFDDYLERLNELREEVELLKEEIL